MFNRWRGTEEGGEPNEQEYHRALTSLYQQVQSVITIVDDILHNLSDTYPKEALLYLSGRFEGISMEFMSYTMAHRSIFYGVVVRSKARKDATIAVAAQAKRVAKLFEKYTKKPNSYSPVESRLEIYKLRHVLENLLSFCI